MFFPDAKSAIILSLRVGLLCAVVSLPFAVAFGYWLARSRSLFKPIVITFLLLPLVMPPVVIGYALLLLFGRQGVLGPLWQALDLSIPFSFAAAVIAAMVVGFPLYVMACRAAFEAVDPRLEEMAATLGQRPLQTFFRVTMPLSLPGIAAGFVLCFARGLGEFGATSVLAGNIEGRTRTIALAVYALLEGVGGEAALGQLLWSSFVLSLAALIGFEALLKWQRKRMGM